MRSLSIPLFVCLLVPTVLVGQVVDGNAEAVNYFPHSQFKIPFNVDARGSLPAQVQLWVSTDNGATWQMHGTSTPDRRGFDFRAAAEGLYLFAVQTVDETGKAYPSTQPPMRIYIDTTRPNIAVKADVNAAGQVVVDIRISEEHLKLDTVRLNYRTDQQTQWQEVEVTNLVSAGEVYEGQLALDIKNCREIGFVVTASDEAANIGKASAQFTMPRTAAADQDIRFASQRTGAPATSQGTGLVPTPGAVAWPANQPPIAGGNFQPRPNNPPPTTSIAGSKQTSPSTPSNSRQPKAMPALGSNKGGWQVSGQLANSNGAAPDNASSGLSLEPPASTSRSTRGVSGFEDPASLGMGSGGANPISSNDSSRQPSEQLDFANAGGSMEELPAPTPVDTDAFGPQREPRAAKPSTDREVPQGRQLVDVPNNRNEVTSDALDGLEPMANPPATPAESDYSSHSQAYHCSSRSFSLDYELNAAAGNMLAEIELWGTEDGGSTWQKWGADPDRQSPFDVQVGNDGLFGFRMVIVSQNGKVSNRPMDGDPADSWIHVDTQRPGAKVTKAVYGEGRDAGMLVIEYVCSDDNLHDRPITLSYGETRNGPWITIATGLKNTGNYLWKAEPTLPGTVFLRLEVVDRAGNVGSHLLDLPINIQGLMPRGRIQGFRPITNPSQP